jgi:hypothetical protein
MRALWIERLAQNQQHIQSDYAGIAQKEINQNDFYNYPDYMFDFWKVEGIAGGYVSNSLNVFGQPDGNFAEICTPYDNQAATIVGEMSSLTGTGTIHVYATLTQAGWNYYNDINSNHYHYGNYVMVEIDNTSPDDDYLGWMEGFVGYAQVTSMNEVDYYNFYAETPFRYIAIGTISMGGTDSYNDFLVDAVNTNSGTGPATLTVSPGDHGTVAAYDSLGHYLGNSGNYSVTQGDYSYVIANPDSYYALDHWNLDSNNVGDENPYSVYMDNDHTVQPSFSLASAYTLTVNAYVCCDYGGGYYGYYSVPTNVYVDGSNWIGEAPTSVQVTLGYHTITVDDPFQDIPFWYMVDQNNAYYDNGGSVLINSQTTINVFYYVYLGQ